MIKKSMIVGVVLFQGFVAFGSQSPRENLANSKDDLRHSRGGASRLSSQVSSQELKKNIAVVNAGVPYFDGCGGWIDNSFNGDEHKSGYDARKPYLPFHFPH